MSIKNSQNQKQPISSQVLPENILVVARDTLFQSIPAWHGINKEAFAPFVDIIQKNDTFMPRPIAETNFDYKQIIPYLIFSHKNKYFVMQRKSTASEQRLASKFSLGIGGHIRKEDIENNDIFDWAKREFEEEVNYTGSLNIKKMGVLNDDSNDVGKVHLGMVLLVEGDNDNITIKNEHKSGTMLTLEECLQMHNSMESWSQMILESLK